MTSDVVFLLDVDNTLLDGDRIVADFQDYLKKELGDLQMQSYWITFDRLRKALGYVDYLGALQHYRLEFGEGSAIIAFQPAADLTIECIDHLTTFDLSHL